MLYFTGRPCAPGYTRPEDVVFVRSFLEENGFNASALG